MSLVYVPPSPTQKHKKKLDSMTTKCRSGTVKPLREGYEKGWTGRFKLTNDVGLYVE